MPAFRRLGWRIEVVSLMAKAGTFPGAVLIVQAFSRATPPVRFCDHRLVPPERWRYSLTKRGISEEIARRGPQGRSPRFCRVRLYGAARAPSRRSDIACQGLPACRNLAESRRSA
ncbi:hypothetical protein FVE89_10855 [Methylobacterium sp. 2A]|nr:hypothetical protein [Methylobacterium sp. 2A]